MKPNLGRADKFIRVALGIILAVLFVTGIVPGIPGILVFTLAFALVVTALISYCPLYSLLGISTCPAKKQRKRITD